MAEFQLELKYQPARSRAAMHALAMLFPIWGVATPTAIVLFLILLLRLPANMPPLYGLVILSGMLAFFAACLLASLFCDDDLIRINKDGFVFPLRFYPALKYRTQRQWNELAAVRLNWKRNDAFSEDETLSLFFNDGARVTLSLPYLRKPELEQFFIAFESCDTNCERDADLPDFQRTIRCKTGTALCSPTELWEKALAQKFLPATFVPLEPDKKLQEGRYQILRQLSFGGSTACYMARCHDGAFAVLKESAFPEGQEIDPKVKEAFQRESTLLSRLDHQSIARVQDHFVESGRHYLVMQHVDGVDLYRLVLQQGRQSSQTTLALLLQLANALQHMHQQSPPIIHRDIRPEVLILRPSGTLVITEFGTARDTTSEFTATINGVHPYAAPEQFKGKPCPRSDVYSLGAIGFYLLTGKTPEPLTPSDVSQHIEQSTNNLLSKLIHRCTAEDPELRPTASAVVSELTDLQNLESKLVPTV